MRVLFTVQPLVGHFHSMVPLAQVLTEQGHDVAFATSERFGPLVQRAGFEHLACGLNVAGSHDILTGLPEWPAIQAEVPHPAFQQIWAFIRGLGPQMVDDLIALIPEWQPDVIVRDPVEFGGYVAAEVFDIPHASILWALYISPRIGCVEPLNALREHCGLPAEPDLASYDRYFVLNGMPPSWHLDAGAPPPPVVHRFCTPPFDQSVAQSLPDWVAELGDRPTIYATLGTAFNKRIDRFQALITALGSEDINAIITVGQSVDPAQFDPPPHVRIERYVPQTLIFPYCDAVAFHGGFNSLHSAVWHGLPVVIMPQAGGDQQPTGEQCAALGLGVLVDGESASPEAIRAAIRVVLDQPEYRERAQQFQREMMALPDLTEAVQRLEVLAATCLPQLGE